jgi:hypothetical protein
LISSHLQHLGPNNIAIATILQGLLAEGAETTADES